MIMKRILYYIWILPLMLSGCEKDLMDYEGLEGVYLPYNGEIPGAVKKLGLTNLIRMSILSVCREIPQRCR